MLVAGDFPKVSETFIVSKFIGLIEKGLDVHIVCSNFEKKNIAAYPQLNPYIHRIHRSWPQRKMLAYVLFPLCLVVSVITRCRETVEFFSGEFSPKRIKKFYRDAVIVALKPHILHFEFGAMAVDREYLKDLLGCKLVLSFRGYDLNYSGLDSPHYYDEVWKYADAVHYLSKDLWEKAKSRGCPPNKPHYLIPPAINTDSFYVNNRDNARGVEIGKPPLRILSVGRLEWVKGYEFAIQAIKHLKNRGIAAQYRIVGAGNYLEAIAFCRHQLALESEVQFLGEKDLRGIYDEMRQADIFLHAAVSEGFCNAVLEAQAMELPIVTSDAGGLPENIQDGVTGWVVPRRDAKALADKIQLLAEDPQLRIKMGKAGRERAVSTFRITDQIDSFQSMYESLS